MTAKELLDALARYYGFVIINDFSSYEDQTVVPEKYRDQEVLHLAFRADDGDGERLLIYMHEEEE